MGPIIGSWPNLWRAKSKQSSRIILIFSSLQYVCWFVHASCLVWPLSLPVAASTMRVVAISDNNFSTKYIQQIVEDFVLLREHAQGLGNWRYFPKVVCVSDFRQCIHGALTRPTIPASISTSVMSHRTSLSMTGFFRTGVLAWRTGQDHARLWHDLRINSVPGPAWWSLI